MARTHRAWVALLVVAAGCTGTAPCLSLTVHPREELDRRIDAEELPGWVEADDTKPIPLSSLVNGWKLYEGGGVMFGLPAEAFAKLVAVKGDERRILYRTTSLAGYVRIRTEEQALELVRLFTNLETHYLFEDFSETEVKLAHGKPELSELAEAEYRRLKITEPSVRRDGNWFVITRYLADDKPVAVRSLPACK